MQVKKFLSILFMFISTVIMADPNAIPVLFSSNTEGSITIYYSYYSLLLLGYGKWLPMIVAVLSVFVILFLLATLKYDVRKITMVLMGLIFISTFFAWITFSTYSVVTLAALIMHLLTFFLQLPIFDRKKKIKE